MSHTAGPRALRTACGIRVGPLAAVPGPGPWVAGEEWTAGLGLLFSATLKLV